MPAVEFAESFANIYHPVYSMKNTKTKIEYMALWFLRKLRDLCGETGFFIKCKEIAIKTLK